MRPRSLFSIGRSGGGPATVMMPRVTTWPSGPAIVTMSSSPWLRSWVAGTLDGADLGALGVLLELDRILEEPEGARPHVDEEGVIVAAPAAAGELGRLACRFVWVWRGH